MMLLLVDIASIALIVAASCFIVGFLATGNIRSPYGQSMVASSVAAILIGVAGLTMSPTMALIAITALIGVLTHRTVLLIAANIRRRPD